jgi:hypothetical protein
MIGSLYIMGDFLNGASYNNIVQPLKEIIKFMTPFMIDFVVKLNIILLRGL